MSSRRAIDQFRPQLKSTARVHPSDSLMSMQAEPPKVEVTTSSTNPDVKEDNPVEEEPITSSPDEEVIPPELQELVSIEQPKPVKRTTQKRRLFKHVVAQMTKSAKVIGVPLVWVGLVAFCGGTGYAAFNLLFTIPKHPNCDQIWFMSSTADKLFCAEQAAKSGKVESLLAGVKFLEELPSNHQLAKQANRLKREWTQRLLEIASSKALQSDFDGAIALAKKIEPSNPLYRNANNAVLEWEKLRSQEQALTNAVEEALKVQNWKKAEANLQPRTAQVSEYQLQQFSRLRERILVERIAYNQLQQLHQLVKNYASNQASILGKAIQLASKIEPTSYIAAKAQADVQQWNQQLVAIASEKLRQNDVAGAISTIQWISADTPLPSDVQELVWLHQAERLPMSGTLTSVSPQGWWQLITTLAAIEQIQPNSPLYQRAQARIPILQQQVQDLSQLNLANRIAQTPNIPSLHLAIQLAQAIAPNSPHRIHAQTLIAAWRKEIERVEDQPYLTDAQTLAKSGQVKDLQAAIAQASKIRLGRALRPTAQAAIFDWGQQIQTIEDKPTLEKARQLAQKNELAKAIQTASTIRTGRALYGEAQDAIRTWTGTLQIMEDRPILDEAKALAKQGRLGAAIDTAYQIAPGRALYEAAQKEIATWDAQLEATRSAAYTAESSDRSDTLNTNSESSSNNSAYQ